jgi:hypothetical protein
MRRAAPDVTPAPATLLRVALDGTFDRTLIRPVASAFEKASNERA